MLSLKENKKIMVFDLDGTLCELSKPVLSENVEKLKLLEQKGNIIAICSGKPCYYLCGLARQLGLNQPLLIGENGASFMEGVSLPPEIYYIAGVEKQAQLCLQEIKEKVKEKLPNVFCQPNSVGFTPFIKDAGDKRVIEQIIADNRHIDEHLQIFRHSDSFDFSPKGIDKQSGLKYVLEYYGFNRNDFIAIGDGENDIPMFNFASVSYGINFPSADCNYTSITECLNELMRRYG